MRNKKRTKTQGWRKTEMAPSLGFLVPCAGQVLLFLQLIMGRAAPGATVCVNLDDYPSRNIPVNSSGYWQFINPYPLAEGIHRISVYAPYQNRVVSIEFEIRSSGNLPLSTVAYPVDGRTGLGGNPLFMGRADTRGTVSTKTDSAE